jgi:hypothetical protein
MFFFEYSICILQGILFCCCRRLSLCEQHWQCLPPCCPAHSGDSKVKHNQRTLAATRKSSHFTIGYLVHSGKVCIQIINDSFYHLRVLLLHHHDYDLERNSVTGFFTGESSFRGRLIISLAPFWIFPKLKFAQIFAAQGVPHVSTTSVAYGKNVWTEFLFIFCLDTIGYQLTVSDRFV